MKFRYYKINQLLLFLFILGYPALLLSQTLTINEMMSSNSTTIADENGDYPDWIEIYNSGTDTIDLDGYGLSDEVAAPFKWLFPSISIKPQQHLLVFASDKNRREAISHWETIINRGDSWKYHIVTSPLPDNWAFVDYDDSQWLSGPSGFGYGDNDDATTVGKTISLLIRQKFVVDDLKNISRAILHVDYDDAFVAYLNGIEIARANIGQPGIHPAYNELATTAREAEIYQGGFPEIFEVDLKKTRLIEGKNVLAIQVHNSDYNSSDLTLIPFFTIGVKNPPENPAGTPDILRLQLPHLHTNFKINSTSETLTLTNPAGFVVDRVQAGNIPTDVSFGRKPDGSSNWFIFAEPTPGTSNSTKEYTGQAEEPQFSYPGGFYANTINLNLKANSPNAIIRYSRDGTDPGESSAIYMTPIIINSTTTIRAKVFESGFLPSRTITNTYFINDRTTLPVISLATTPANLWDQNDGIHVLGNNYDPNPPNYGANFWQDWERPIHVEFYESTGAPGFSIDAGVKIWGGWSRMRPQKPLAIFARSKYGYPEIIYQLFPDREIYQFQAFGLRNSANDWDRTMFSDGLMHRLVETIDLDIMAYRPCVVYLNGEYWGILNIREKMNEHYLATHHDVNPDSIDLLEFDGSPIHGDAVHYRKMYDFISDHDMSIPQNYEYVKTMMEVDNFIDYNVVQIYYDNRDWPGNNIKFWRPKTKDGKWRWLLYDTDWGFGVNGYGRGGNVYVYDYNTLEYATSPTPTPNHHANPPWSTLLLRKLLENAEFKYEFINRFADYFNTIFQPEVVVEKINTMQAIIEPEMPHHYEKWRRSVWWSPERLWWSSLSQWYQYVQILRDFASNRIPFVQSHIIKKFKLAGVALFTLNAAPPEGGQIKINTIEIVQFPWQGYYFMNTPIPITAIPAPNYKFVGWSGISSSDTASISVELSHNTSLIAMFEPDTTKPPSIVINEINYNSAPDFDTDDWIELYNHSESSFDISGWQFKDSDERHSFIIPNHTVLDSKAYWVLCQDTTRFKAHFPEVKCISGNFDFGLSGNGELIQFYTADNRLVDSVRYGVQFPWMPEPNGNGPTLELKSPNLDNALPESWTASSNHGTPGAANGSYIGTVISSSINSPTTFALRPNYPNPFNPITTISFQIPLSAFVNLTIYNLSGQLVETVLNERMKAGYYQFQWNANNHGSGIYLIKLTVESFSAGQKCLLLK